MKGVEDRVGDCNLFRQAVKDLEQTADKICHFGPVVLFPSTGVPFLVFAGHGVVAAGCLDILDLAAVSGVLRGAGMQW